MSSLVGCMSEWPSGCWGRPEGAGEAVALRGII